MRRAEARGALLLLVLGAPAGSRQAFGAAEVTDVASAFDKDNPFDFRLRVGYEYSTKTASIKREHEGAGQDEVDVLQGSRLPPGAAHDVRCAPRSASTRTSSVSIELPFVLSDNRELSATTSASAASASTPARDANCVNAGNSIDHQQRASPTTPPTTRPDATTSSPPAATTRSEQLAPPLRRRQRPGVPRPASAAAAAPTSSTRINFGLTWARALAEARRHQAHLDHQASSTSSRSATCMTLRSRPPRRQPRRRRRARPLRRAHRRLAPLQVRRPVRRVLVRLPVRPSRRHAVLRLRPQREEPAAADVAAAPASASRASRGSSDNGELQDRHRRERPHLGKFDGRGYSEIWEMLASSPALAACDPTSANYNPACDPQASTPDSSRPNAYQGQPYTGLTMIENYATPRRRGRAHRAGRQVRPLPRQLPLPARPVALHHHRRRRQARTSPAAACRSPSEFNPAFRPIINEIGRRYKVDDVDIYTVGALGAADVLARDGRRLMRRARSTSSARRSATSRT